MASFKDSSNREWSIVLDAPLISRVRELADPDFLRGDAIETLQRLQDDLVLLCCVVHALCKDQVSAKGLTDQQFYEAVVGNAIDAATKALLEALLNFSPPAARKMLETCAAENAAARELATEKAIAAVKDPALKARISAAIDKEIDSIIEKALTPSKSATN